MESDNKFAISDKELVGTKDLKEIEKKMKEAYDRRCDEAIKRREEESSDEAKPKREAAKLGTNPKDLLGTKKPNLSLVPPSSLIYQALAMQDGATKYGPYNWRENKVIATIYIDAAMRHLGSWLDGEECASDSQKPHLAHALACIGIIVDALETGNLVDNRPAPGCAAKLIEKWTKK